MVEVGLNSISGFFNQMWQAIIGFLPKSPLRPFIDEFVDIPFLAELNWFIPVKDIVRITEAWLAVVVIYYSYQAIMRFLKIL